MQYLYKHYTLNALAIAAMLLAVACSGGETSPVLVPDSSDATIGEVADGTTFIDSAEPDIVPDIPEAPEIEVVEPPDEKTPLAAFGDPCIADEECESDICLYGECSVACQDECPDGYVCAEYTPAPEPGFACIPVDLTSCSPCSADADCQPYGMAGGELAAYCIDYGIEGAFCAIACTDDESCGNGYECIATASLDGDDVSVCKRKTGVCDCSNYAVDTGVSTPCLIGNEIGSCVGERYCTEEGLIECQGEAATVEVCDGLDNDCDGEVDDKIEAGDCSVENDIGICTGQLLCTDGEEFCDALIPTEELCDKIDNNCDGEIDEGFADDNDNGILDCLEGDSDDDGVVDADDNCVDAPNPEQTDSDDDGAGDACDDDDDNDGVPDDDDCMPLNALISPDAEEICNGIDDNCDGETDEGFVDSNEDGTKDCMEPDTDGDAVFDYEDNCPLNANPSQQDLDDDGLGDKCDDDDDGDGTVDADDCAPADAEIYPGAEELCNGKDDDCNGEVDEGYPDENGNGEVDCLESDTDEDGLLDFDDNCIEVPNPEQEDLDEDGQGDACDADDDGDGELDETDCEPLDGAIFPDALEACNGYDDNCNDQPDEGFGELTCGLGECVTTAFECVDGVPQECVPVEGSDELCDELDNDCDGETDEDFPDENGNGVVDCLEKDTDEDGWLDDDDNCPEISNSQQEDLDQDGMGDACDDDDDGDGDGDLTDCEPLNADIFNGADEACNGLDDNCVLGADEGFGDITCGTGECIVTVQECVDGAVQECVPGDPTDEICDGLNNDCDEETDEDFPDEDGNGIVDCLELDTDQDGVVDIKDNCPELANPEQEDNDQDGPGDVCDADDDNDGEPDETDCAPFDAAVSPGAEELCNGIDDNCAEGVDEGFGDLTCGIGACEVTIAYCQDGALQECVPGEPTDEVCDGLNNDCDEETDEDFGPVTCGLGVCDHTIESCVDGAPVECDPLEGSGDEACDGLDNNCNGETDEGLGQTTCGLGVCEATTDNCVDGETVECVPVEDGGVHETCDGLDNDCDGEVDEDSTDCTNYFLDTDEDDYGTDETICDCAPIDQYTAVASGDCNDEDPAINPAAVEICADAIDNDCNPETTCNTATLDGEEVVIDTYKGDEPPADFFSYGDPDVASFNTGLEEDNTIVVMLYRDPDGETYLALTIDGVGDGTGGAAVAKFEGLFGASLVVSDDPGEATMNSATGVGVGNWKWAGCCTDGVIYGPLGCNGHDYDVTITFESLTGIDTVKVLDGVGGSIDIVDPTQPISLKGTVDPGPVAPDEVLQSCKAILDAGESTGSGTYWVDTDGDGPGTPKQVLCDMATNGGGWTMCGKFDRDNEAGLRSLPANWGRADVFAEDMAKVGGFCLQGASIDCRALIADGATQILNAATNDGDQTAWMAGRIIDLPEEVKADPANLWDVTLDEAGEDVCTSDAVVTRNLLGVDMGASDSGASLGERAALIGDGAFFTNAGRLGAAFSNAGIGEGVNACYGTGHDTVYWAWADAEGAQDDHGCAGSSGLLQLGNGCGQGSGWSGKPTYRYNLLMVR